MDNPRLNSDSSEKNKPHEVNEGRREKAQISLLTTSPFRNKNMTNLGY
jgi:hypothetical protein